LQQWWWSHEAKGRRWRRRWAAGAEHLLIIVARPEVGGCGVRELARLAAFVLRCGERKRKDLQDVSWLGTSRIIIKKGTWRDRRSKRRQSPPSTTINQKCYVYTGPKKLQLTPKERNKKKCKRTSVTYTGKSTRKPCTCQLHVNPKNNPKL
jgi:hypothetical protein